MKVDFYAPEELVATAFFYFSASASARCILTFVHPVAAIQAVSCINNHWVHGSQLSVQPMPIPQEPAKTQPSVPRDRSVVVVCNVSDTATPEHISVGGSATL